MSVHIQIDKIKTTKQSQNWILLFYKKTNFIEYLNHFKKISRFQLDYILNKKDIR